MSLRLSKRSGPNVIGFTRMEHTKMTKLKDTCMALLAMLFIILFPNMEDV